MRRHYVIALFVCTISIATTALAQDSKRFGLVLGSSIAALWKPSASFGIRPEISISHVSATSKNTPTGLETTNTGLQLPFAISALFYTAEKDHLRLYLSPAYTYQRNSSSSTVANANTNTVHTNGGRGSFGAEYAISDRFSAFGEVGIGYTHQKARNSSNTTETTTGAWFMRSGVGVILFF